MGYKPHNQLINLLLVAELGFQLHISHLYLNHFFFLLLGRCPSIVEKLLVLLTSKKVLHSIVNFFLRIIDLIKFLLEAGFLTLLIRGDVEVKIIYF